MSATCQPYQIVRPELVLYHSIRKISLAQFIREAWDTIETEELQWNWHIDAICAHLEAVTEGKIRRLIINVPPRHMKSLIVSVFWPAWVWTRYPHYRWLVASHDTDLSLDLSVKCRDVIESEWYQSHWGHTVQLAGDQNAKGKFRNKQKGVRQAVSITGGVTGKGANIIIVDDPHDTKHATSKAKIKASKEGYRALSSRKNNPKKSATVIIAQRVSDDDLCADLIKKGGWDHVCIPSEYEEVERKPTSIGWSDPRKKAGDLLWPERFDKQYIEDSKIELLDYGYAAQHQQRPSPLGGGLFKVERLRANLIDKNEVPCDLRTHRHWDFAAAVPEPGTDPDWTVGFKLGLHHTGKLYILDIVRLRADPETIETTVKGTALSDGFKTSITIEQEKASAGTHLCDHYRRHVLQGFAFEGQIPKGDKVERARPLAARVKAGDVYVVRGAWNEDLFEEWSTWPFSAHKDQGDGGSGAYLALTQDKSGGSNEGEIPEAANF